MCMMSSRDSDAAVADRRRRSCMMLTVQGLHRTEDRKSEPSFSIHYPSTCDISTWAESDGPGLVRRPESGTDRVVLHAWKLLT